MRRRVRRALLVCMIAGLLAGLACGKHSHGPLRATLPGGAGPPAVQTWTATASLPALNGTAPAASVPAAPAGYVVADPRFDPLPGARALYGRLGGAAYEIELPQNWNGSLVLYAHGYTGTDPILFVQAPPLRVYLIEQGFAWAASSFSASGYVPDLGVTDTLALLDRFVHDVGAPARTYIYGTSMGGHIVVSALEQHAELFSGGFSACGVVAGVEEMDYLTSYVTLASYLTSTALWPITDAKLYRDAVQLHTLPTLGPAEHPTQAGSQFEAVVELLTGGARPWRHEGFVERRAANFDLAAADDPRHPSLAARAGTNISTVYQIDPGRGIDAARLNAEVPRVPADPSVRNPAMHPDYAPRTGRLRAPLLTLHTTGDHFVPISLEQSYRRTVDSAGAAGLLVQRAIRRPGHCQFTQAELSRGFADLVDWVEHGTVPAGDDLRSPDLRDVGRSFTQPLLVGDPGTE